MGLRPLFKTHNMILETEAARLAATYLEKEENHTVHVNQHGLIWVNNPKDYMEQYFAVKKQKFWVFEKEGAEAPKETKKGKK